MYITYMHATKEREIHAHSKKRRKKKILTSNVYKENQKMTESIEERDAIIFKLMALYKVNGFMIAVTLLKL